MKGTGWLRGLEVTADGTGIVSHAGVALLRALGEIAGGGSRARLRITRAVNAARRQAWSAITARHGAMPGIQIADKTWRG